jgi:hypothetical protein
MLKTLVAILLVLCVGIACATNYMPTDRYSFTIEGVPNPWHEVLSVSESTIAANGTTCAFNVSERWKIEYSYIGNHQDSCFRVIVRDPKGYLMSYYLICDVEFSSGIIHCQGAKEGISLDVFAGRLKSWNISVSEYI